MTPAELRARMPALNLRAMTGGPRIERLRAAVERGLADRSPRERQLLAALAAVAVVVLLMVAVVRPLQAARATAAADIRTYDTLDGRLRAAGPALAARPGAPRGSPATIITDTAEELNVVIQRIEPEDGKTRVVLENARFDAVLSWLARLEADSGIAVAEIKLDRQSAPGVVNAEILLAS